VTAVLGGSMVPLRQALRRLPGEGLVVLQPNHGATVADLDFGDMRDAWTARLVIEPAAARVAAARSPAADLEPMRDAIARQRAQPDPAGSLDANREFHPGAGRRPGNPHLRHFAELLWVARISVAIYTAQAAQAEGSTGWASEHEAIADAARRRRRRAGRAY
jgi:DNA-binding GntR family transcriptional regulator